MAKKRWTKEEKEILCKLVEENPGSLKHAFFLFSQKTGRGEAAIRHKWYLMVNENIANNQKVVVGTITRKKVLRNRKNNSKYYKQEDCNSNIVKTIKLLFKKITNFIWK